MLYVGFGVAKHKHDSEGTSFIRHLQINNTREGFTILQSSIANLQKTTEEDIQIDLEDTEYHYFIFFDPFIIKAIKLSDTLPLLIKEFAKHHSFRKIKTDKKTI